MQKRAIIKEHVCAWKICQFSLFQNKTKEQVQRETYLLGFEHTQLPTRHDEILKYEKKSDMGLKNWESAPYWSYVTSEQKLKACVHVSISM